MFAQFIRSLSLKTRVVLLVVVLLVAGIWGLAVRAGAVLQSDLERALSDQLLATVGYVAAGLDGNIRLRFKALHEIAAAISSEMPADPRRLQARLQRLHVSATLFRTGVFVADKSGRIVADYPGAPGRIGGYVGDRGYFKAVMAGDERVVSTPRIGRFSKVPLVSLALPLRDAAGKPVAALIGTLFPSDDNLFGPLEATRLGKAGYFLVASPRDRVFVSATDKSRILQPLPAPGVNPLLDRRMNGFEGAGVVVSSRGVEVLTASRNMKTTGWIVIAAIPTAEAFAPIAVLKRQIYVAALLISLLVALALRALLARQLAPLDAAAAAMQRMTEGKQSFAPLPIARDDEIGALVGNFNRLMTERDRLEQTVRRSRERFRDLAALSSDWYWEQDANLRFTRMSEELYPKARLRPESTLGKLRWELPIVGLSAAQWRAHRALLERREPFSDFVYQMVNEQGERRWFSINGKPLFGAHGEFLGYRGTGRDITEQKRAEETRARLAAIVENSSDAIVSRTLEGTILSWNAAAERLFGYTAAEATGKSIAIILPSGRMEQHLTTASVLRGGGSVPPTEVQRRAKDGRLIDVLRSVSPIRDESGEVAAAAVIMHDITERKRAEAALASKTAVLTATLDNMAQGLSMVDGELRVLAWNRRLLELLDFPQDLFREGLALEDLFLYNARRGEYGPGDPQEQVRRRMELARRNESHLFVRTRPNGTVLEVHGEPIPGGGFVTTYTDITQRKAAEAELVHLNAVLEQRVAERTAELERANRELEAFTYSVSHDLRAPLRAISGFSEIVLARNAPQLDAESAAHLQRVIAAGRRMGMLIDDLLALSRVSRQPVKRRSLDLSAMAGEVAAALAQAEPGRSVRVSVQPQMTVVADPGLMRIVMENLVGNAWKFSARACDPRIEIGSEERDGGRVYFVRDNGAGFDMDYVDQLFKPFRRLHAESEFEGTGIGLSIVQRVLARHGGKVWGAGEKGRGAVFYFTVQPNALQPPP